MPRPLDGVYLQAYYRRLVFSTETQAILNNIRSSPPSRTPSGCKGNVVVSYPSRKMQCIIKAESYKVEFAFLLEAEHHDDVIEFYDQPPSFQIEYRDKRGHLQRPKHTPDYFVFRYHSAGWEECKPTQELVNLAQERPNRYVLDENGQWRCPPGEAYAAQFGLTYRIRSSDEINWAAQDNWLFLEDYYQDLDRLSLTEAALTKLIDIVREAPGITLSDLLLETPDLTSDMIYIAIAQHYLYVDLASYRLSEPFRTGIYIDRQNFLANARREGTSFDIGIDAHPVIIALGSSVDWDGRKWQIANFGQTEVTLINDKNHPFTLPRTAFEELVKKGKIVGMKITTHSSITPEGQAILKKVRPVDNATATFRDRVIHPERYDDEEQVRTATERDAVNHRTKRHWEKLYREAEIQYGSGLIGLMPGYGNCGHVCRIEPGAIEIIDEVLKTHFNTVTRKPKRGSYGEYVRLSEERKVPTISERSFYKQVQLYKTAYEETLAREGERSAYAFKDYHREANQTISRHGQYAWSMGHLDHEEVDLQLRDSKTGKLLGKCWLTMMVLSQPRRIAAYYVTFDPPSYRSCLMVMRLCVKRYGRLPTAITVDRGAEFRSVYFDKLLAIYQVRKHQRPKSEPRYGATLERLFGTMNTQFIYHLLGNTQALKNPRSTTKATDPRRHAVWTLAKLIERVQQWADEEYDTISHPALGQSPRQAYQQSLERDGERTHKIIPYDDVFKMITFPTTKLGSAIVQPGRGVRMNYLDYWCEEMRDAAVERTKVQVRFDPFDITTGYAYINGQWRECHCSYHELHGCTERELEILSSEIRKRNRVQYGRKQVEVTQKQLAIFRQENAAAERLLVQQRKDQETSAALAVLEGKQKPSRPSDPSNSVPVPKDADLSSMTKQPTISDPQTNKSDTLIVLKRHRHG